LMYQKRSGYETNNDQNGTIIKSKETDEPNEKETGI